MGIKMTLAEKWRDRWFRKLDPVEKLAFLYMCDSCDCAGFLEVDIEKFSFETGVPKENWEKMLGLEGTSKGLKGSSKGLEGSNKGLKGSKLCEKVVIHGRWVWVKNHIRHQKNLPFIAKNPMHKGIVKRLVEHMDIPGVVDFIDKNVDDVNKFVGKKLRPYPDPSKTLPRVTGKGKGKGKGIGIGGDCKEGDDSVLPPGDGSDNELFKRISGHENVIGLDYEKYLTALKDYDITEKDVRRNIEWLMQRVVLFGNIEKPGMWLAKRFSEMERGEKGVKKPKKNGSGDMLKPIDGEF